MKPRPSLLLLAATLAACSLSTTLPPGDDAERDRRAGSGGTVEERRIGTIEHYHDPIVVTVPASVTRGEEFAVRVRTYGGGCVVKGDTDVRVQGSTAVVTPHDWEVVLPANHPCTEELRMHEHVGAIRFDVAGTATVEVLGRRLPSGELVRVRRQVSVR